MRIQFYSPPPFLLIFLLLSLSLSCRTKKKDRLRWYCDQCKEIVYEESFHCVDLGKQLAPVINRYAADISLRKCKACGHTNAAK